MKVGITGAGLGESATGAVIKTAAQAAERAGFSTFWVGEHVVLFEHAAEAKYPYEDRDRKARRKLFDPGIALTDPIVSMTWAAAATTSIEIGTAILILPQRNPVVLAKELSTLDAFSDGRVVLGVGTGWSTQEYEAIGADWPNRGKRADEFVGVLRSLWRDNPSTFHGETIKFDRAYLSPKPVRNDIPIIFGGESEAVLRRTARCGDGWMPVKLSPEDAIDKVRRLRSLTTEAGRDPDSLRIIKSITMRDSIDELKRFRDAGVTEFKVSCFGELPVDEGELTACIEDFGKRLVEPAAAL